MPEAGAVPGLERGTIMGWDERGVNEAAFLDPLRGQGRIQVAVHFGTRSRGERVAGREQPGRAPPRRVDPQGPEGEADELPILERGEAARARPLLERFQDPPRFGG